MQNSTNQDDVLQDATDSELERMLAEAKGGKFCPECGASLAPKSECPKCGANMPEVARILAACAEGVRIAAVLLAPIMPGKCAEVLAAYGCTATDSGSGTGPGLEAAARWGGLAAGTRIEKCAPFMRVDAPVA